MTRRSSSIIAAVAGVVVAGGVTTAVLAAPSEATSAGGTALVVGQTVDIATNVTVPAGTNIVEGPVNTKNCPRVEEYIDTSEADYGQIRTGMFVQNLPGEAGYPMGLPYTQADGGTFTETSEPAPQVSLNLTNETASDHTVLNVYIYCAQ